MTIYAYRRTFIRAESPAEPEERIDYSPNLEELLLIYRREKDLWYFQDRVILKGELLPIAEFKITDL